MFNLLDVLMVHSISESKGVKNPNRYRYIPPSSMHIVLERKPKLLVCVCVCKSLQTNMAIFLYSHPSSTPLRSPCVFLLLCSLHAPLPIIYGLGRMGCARVNCHFFCVCADEMTEVTQKWLTLTVMFRRHLISRVLWWQANICLKLEYDCTLGLVLLV